ENIASGEFSFAAGQQAEATNDGSFVWADSQDAVFGSTINDSFNIRAQGGAHFVTSGAGLTIDGQAVLTAGSLISPANLPNGLGGSGNTVSGASSVVGGGHGNTASGNFATVAGGQVNSATNGEATVGGGNANHANGDTSTVAGGGFNVAGGDRSTVGGGVGNQATGFYATVGGGDGNIASGSEATIGGGQGNTNNGNAGFIGGGQNNTVGDGYQPTIGGGYGNIASNNYATVSGGIGNVAGGNYSFAAGHNAQALNQGAFVWSDGTGTATASASDNSVTFRASGGYRLLTSTGNAGVSLAAGGTSWATISDQNAKKNFAPVNGEAVLDKLAQVPVEKWNYKWEKNSDTPNIGPMAQAFKAAFYPGRDDKSITTLEFDGVELAAIQGLNEKLNEKDAEIQQLQQRLDKLEKLISESPDKR
ncbi:MAG: tail fiber domain-containing protein, partial [Limisphaerales bacterium]